LIDLGNHKKAHVSDINRNTKLSNFIDVNNIKIDHLEKNLSYDDIESINIPDNDFLTYMYNGKEPVKVDDNCDDNNDEYYSNLYYEEKVVFLASKLYKSKMYFWSQKFQDINNKPKSYITYQNMYTKSTRASWYNILNKKQTISLTLTILIK
jgi:hypothetical protein